jgi:hypothetical protein
MVLNFFSGWLAGWLASFPNTKSGDGKGGLEKVRWGGGGGEGKKKKEGIKLGTKHRVNLEYKNR